MSPYYQKTEANQVLETFARLYLETKSLDDTSIDDLSLPDYIRTQDNWEYKSDEFWEYKSMITKEIDNLAEDINA